MTSLPPSHTCTRQRPPHPPPPHTAPRCPHTAAQNLRGRLPPPLGQPFGISRQRCPYCSVLNCVSRISAWFSLPAFTGTHLLDGIVGVRVEQHWFLVQCDALRLHGIPFHRTPPPLRPAHTATRPPTCLLPHTLHAAPTCGYTTTPTPLPAYHHPAAAYRVATSAPVIRSAHHSCEQKKKKTPARYAPILPAIPKYPHQHTQPSAPLYTTNLSSWVGTRLVPILV